MGLFSPVVGSFEPVCRSRGPQIGAKYAMKWAANKQIFHVNRWFYDDFGVGIPMWTARGGLFIVRRNSAPHRNAATPEPVEFDLCKSP